MLPRRATAFPFRPAREVGLGDQPEVPVRVLGVGLVGGVARVAGLGGVKGAVSLDHQVGAGRSVRVGQLGQRSLSPGARMETDERRNRGLYRDDSTWAHGSEWPKEDDLGRYLGFHSLMTVAGTLIRQQPVCSGEPDEVSTFAGWLQGFRPSLQDG